MVVYHYMHKCKSHNRYTRQLVNGDLESKSERHQKTKRLVDHAVALVRLFGYHNKKWGSSSLDDGDALTGQF